MANAENSINLSGSGEATGRSHRRRGFSLTEVLFAVIILGIGFILIAAIFPVSISQSRMTVDETTGAAAARSAMAFTSRIADGGDVVINGPLFPTTDLYVGPAQGGAAQTAVGSFSIPPNSQIRVGKVLSFNDPRLSNGTPGPGPNYRDNLWNAIKGSIIQPSDNRYAWVPFYRRDAIFQNTTSGTLTVNATNLQGNLDTGALLRQPSPYAQVYFLPVAVRNRSTYDVTATSPDLAAGVGNLLPRVVQVQIAYNASAADYIIQFRATPGAAAITPGCFVVISDDHIVSPAADMGILNGRVYRVGNQRLDLAADGSIWELAPGSSFASDPGANGKLYDAQSNDTDTDDVLAIGNITVPTPAQLPPTAQYQTAPTDCAKWDTNTPYAEAFIIGRNGNAGVFEGTAQDIGAYVTFVKAN